MIDVEDNCRQGFVPSEGPSRSLSLAFAGAAAPAINDGESPAGFADVWR